MLAARDQENLAYAHQQAAASKPLNQAPKTPGPRANFGDARMTNKKALRNDENNAPLATGKKALGGKDKIGITPAPRVERAPLGAKTTNAKAKGIQTPAPLTGGARQGLAKIRQQSISARKSKLKIHQQLDEPVAHDSEEDFIPEVEFCPPKITELPDYPDPNDPFEIKPDEEFPQFAPENYNRGAYEAFRLHAPDGLTDLQRRMKHLDETEDQWIEEESRKFAEMLSLEDEPMNSRPATAKSAKSAKSMQPQHTRAPSFARPTASTEAKSSAPTRRMTPGVAASRTTIGRAKGRQIATSLKRDENGPAQHRSELLDELLRDEEQLLPERMGIDFTPLVDEEYNNFQLDIPESP